MQYHVRGCTLMAFAGRWAGQRIGGVPRRLEQHAALVHRARAAAAAALAAAAAAALRQRRRACRRGVRAGGRAPGHAAAGVPLPALAGQPPGAAAAHGDLPRLARVAQAAQQGRPLRMGSTLPTIISRRECFIPTHAGH